MARMTAATAAVRVLELEGVSAAFGVPGAAINPFYAAMQGRGSIRHILARHVEGASHMAEGYTRARAGNIGVCVGTSGPAGTDMITGLYSSWADSIPILCVTGQAPRARLHKEDFQAVDIEDVVSPFDPDGPPPKLTETKHPANSDLTPARTLSARIRGLGIEYSADGQSGFSTPFSWSG